MYTSIDEFLKDWKLESEITLKLFRAMKDEALSVKAWDNGRTLGRLAWHLVLSIGEIAEKAGFKVDAPPEDDGYPSNAAFICEKYEKASNSFMEMLPKVWSDDMLPEEMEVYGKKWKRGEFLTMLVHHQIHHRGQMTVLMRLAGLKIPGVTGPSYEEWALWGMEPAK